MLTVNVFLVCAVMCSIANASTLFPRVSSVGYNKTALRPSGASSGHGVSSISSMTSPNASKSHNISVDSCCDFTQDGIYIGFWADYHTDTTILSTYMTSFITFATQYIDTLITTNVSTVIKTASCLPRGPSFIFVHDDFCPKSGLRIAHQQQEAVLTVSSTVTIPGRGCFHPGACPTPAAPGATAVSVTPVVTHAAQSQDTTSTARPENPLPPQAPGQLLPAPAETPGSTPPKSPEDNAANVPLNIVTNPSSPSPPNVAILPPSTPTDSSETPSADLPENNPPANHSPDDPAKPPSKFSGLAAVQVNAFGFNTNSPSQSEDLKPGPGPTPTQLYSLSIAPSASAVIINGITSVPPAVGNFFAGTIIAVGSEQVSQNAASQYMVAGQTLTPGAPAINVQGTQVSLAPSASAIVIAGSTIVLSSTSGAPAFTVGSDIVTANSASQYVVDGQTLIPGGSAITVSGTPISIAPSGTQVVIGSNTIGLVPTIAHPPPPSLTFGSETYTANSKSEYIINGQTLIPGSPAITVSGTPISLAPGGKQVVIGSSTKDLAPVITPSPLTFGSQTITANSASQYIIDDQTLIPGGPAIMISGTPISLAPGATEVVIGSSTKDLAPVITPPPLTFGSQTITANSASQYIINGQTLTPGGPAITVSGTRLSLASSATQFIIGSSTIDIDASSTPPPLTFGFQTITANSASQYIINGQTLTPGGPAITVSGTRLSLAPSATQFIIGSSTINIAGAAAFTPPPLTFGSQTITANSASQYIINGQTLTPGGPAITVSGTRLSLAPSGTQVVIGSSTIPLSLSHSPALPTLTIGSQTYTPNSAGAYVIAGQTLIPGSPAITVSNTPVSLAPSGTQIVIGSNTIPLSLSHSPALPALTFGSQTYTPNAAGAYVIAGQTLTPGASGIVVAGSMLLDNSRSGILLNSVSTTRRVSDAGGGGEGTSTATLSKDPIVTGSGGHRVVSISYSRLPALEMALVLLSILLTVIVF